MNLRETDKLKRAIQEHQTKKGNYKRIFVNYTYAFRLQKEMKCTEVELARNVGIMHLIIVDGLNQDFKIVS